MDKNKAVIDYLFQCPTIASNPLYFNFSTAEDNNKQLLTTGNDKAIHKAYVDGSVLKQYTFTIIDYRSIIYQSIVNMEGYDNENVEEMFDVQSLIDWITEQDEEQNFPDFGPDCIVESIMALTDNPNLNSVDTSVTPKLAKYSISIRIQYLDTSKIIFK